MNGIMECSGDLERNSCSLSPAEDGERDALAAVRMIISLLSIMGASALIAGIIKRRLKWNSMMQPIFQLSVADLLLGVLWVIGACLWFRGVQDRTWCFAVSLLTVILECVTANLTLVYAIIVYSILKKKSRSSSAVGMMYGASLYTSLNPVKSVLVYLTSWILPTVVIMVIFGVLAGSTHIVKDANSCTCWCFPHLGNVLPYSLGRDVPSAIYVLEIRKLQVAYSVILLLNFLTVLVVMAVLYWKILKEIQKIKNKVAELGSEVMNHAMEKSQSKARKRIVYFLSVFLAIAVSIVILCFLMVVYEGQALTLGVVINSDPISFSNSASHYKFYMVIHLFQSVTVPLQGFLNAIVYGGTREDEGGFINMMKPRKLSEGDRTETHAFLNESSEVELFSDEDNDSTS